MGDEAWDTVRVGLLRLHVSIGGGGVRSTLSLLLALTMGCASSREAIEGSMGGGGAAGPSDGQGGASGAFTENEGALDCSAPESRVAPSGCHESYFPCVPNASDVDVNCGPGAKSGVIYVEGPVCVLRDDVHGLDGDKDGVGCE